MEEVLNRYNIPIKRGFCTCPFHKGDHTASMKVYDKSFYCFGCGKGGDVIEFVKLYEGLKFEDACRAISGEVLDKTTKDRIEYAISQREHRQKQKEILKKKLDKVNDLLSGLWQKYLNAEPFSDEWCNAYNTWQKLCYQQEQLLNELGEI